VPLTMPKGTEFDPVGDQLVCRMYSPSGTWREGSKLVLPETSAEEIFFATVRCTGPGRMIDLDSKGNIVRAPMDFSVGDDVIFSRFHGERVTIEGAMYVVLRHDDILTRVYLPKDKKEKFFKFAGEGDLESLGKAKVHGDR
jgi:co-chaperonin GroES (HSP10)